MSALYPESEKESDMMSVIFCDVTPCGSCKTDISEEPTASNIRVKRIGDLVTALAITSN
jgi:hypothetical protein